VTDPGSEARIRAEARIGAVLNDKWTLERLIGLGGMAAVYAGRHRNGARGAVKLLHPELAMISEVRERFLREGYAANKVDHPNAVRVLDDDVITSGPDEGSAYLIMELLEGISLEDRIHDGGPFTIEEALAIADDVLEVLDAAHAHGVIHRDLKPENLLLAAGDGPFGFSRVMVLDFGLARLAHGEVVTRAGMALGTPSYMAPEQAEGRSEAIDGRSDVFALGAILFRLITGRRVHESSNVVELVTKMARLPAPKIKSVRSDVAEPFATIVDRSLQFKPADRYQTAKAMRDDVRAAREGRPLPSLGHEKTEAIELTPQPIQHKPALEPQPTAARAKPKKNVGVILSVIWVVLIAAAGAAVIGVMRKGRVDTSMGSGSAMAPASAPASEVPPVGPSAASSTEDLEALVDAGASDAHAAKAVATAKPKTTTTLPKKPPPKKKK
jgi:eukaryotic-like serine/threonine-protein kinase